MLFEMDFTRSVQIAPFVSKNAYGKATYGAPVTYPACLDYTVKNIVDFRGNTFITSSWIALPPDTPVYYEDQVTLPNGAKPYIGTISDAYDEEARKVLYKVVYVGRPEPGEGTL